MQPENNPLLNIPDPFEGYRASMKDMQWENPKAMELERLCYEVFVISKEGQKLYKHLEERHLIPSQVVPSHPQAMQLAMYFEGFREAIRGLKGMALVHQQRIAQAGVKS